MAKAKRAAPQKTCPQCNTAVHARTKRCDCGYEFQTPPHKTVTPESGPDIEKLALEFCLLSAGGIDKAIKAVEAYKADDTAKYITNCGGPSKALNALKRLAEKKK